MTWWRGWKLVRPSTKAFTALHEWHIDQELPKRLEEWSHEHGADGSTDT